MATLCVERAFFKSLAGRLYQIRSDLDSEIFKSNYWPRDFSGQVNKALEIISEMVNDYNDIRPHGSLIGLTPFEALMNENTGSIGRDGYLGFIVDGAVQCTRVYILYFKP